VGGQRLGSLDLPQHGLRVRSTLGLTLQDGDQLTEIVARVAGVLE
jgi:hypothetical protein